MPKVTTATQVSAIIVGCIIILVVAFVSSNSARQTFGGQFDP